MQLALSERQRYQTGTREWLQPIQRARIRGGSEPGATIPVNQANIFFIFPSLRSHHHRFSLSLFLMSW